MDVHSMREIWGLINTMKVGRTVVLTTHSMEEAETLGDRIAVMSKGRLQTVGSSMFLKKRFGVGYQLTVDFVDGYERCVEEVLRLARGYFPGLLYFIQWSQSAGIILNYFFIRCVH
jgi:ABC-type multidrug transport system ATPase subunit